MYSRTSIRVSPKQPSSARQRDWYPYYAGFTERFAEAVICEHLAEAASVLDPWSGSGTTAAVAARLGTSSVGVDINPALTVIARARLTPRDCRHSNQQLLDQVFRTAPTLDSQPPADDPLRRWLRDNALRRVRSLQQTIHHLVKDAPPLPDCGCLLPEVHTLSPSACLLYAALFATIRDLLRKFRTTNPTWIKSPPTYRNRLATSWPELEALYRRAFAFLHQRLTLDSASPEATTARLQTGFRQFPILSRSSLRRCLDLASVRDTDRLCSGHPSRVGSARRPARVSYHTTSNDYGNSCRIRSPCRPKELPNCLRVGPHPAQGHRKSPFQGLETLLCPMDQ